MCLEIFNLRNEPKHNLKFQVDPPFIFSDVVQNIALQDSEMQLGTSVVVTGWGENWVSQYIKYCVEQQLIFYQNFRKWTTTYHKYSIT
jgi:hypothetical protein